MCVKLPLSEEECIKNTAVYHSDMYDGWRVPAHFRQTLNRIYRKKNKAILNRAVRCANDEPMFIPYIKDALWEWW